MKALTDKEIVKAMDNEKVCAYCGSPATAFLPVTLASEFLARPVPACSDCYDKLAEDSAL